MYGTNLQRLALLSLLLAAFAPSSGDVQAQKREHHSRETNHALVTLSFSVSTKIREFYSARPASGVKPLPPGIRRRLARGKPLPPGIAKQVAPMALRTRLDLPRGFHLLEVGLDVLLVEAATGIVHDVLIDVVR